MKAAANGFHGQMRVALSDGIVAEAGWTDAWSCTQRGHWAVIDRNIIPIMGRMKVQDVKRPDIAAQTFLHTACRANQ